MALELSRLKRAPFALPVALACLLLVVGLSGHLTAAWGYGLFLAAVLVLGAGVAVFLVFILTNCFDGAALRGTFVWLLRIGGWTYVFAVAAFAGYYTSEALAGRVEYKWMLFGPSALAALIALDWGLYRMLVLKNLPSWQRYGHLISRAQSNPAAMRRTLLDEVILHRTLFSVSRFRWLRHTLIFWGFGLLFMTDVLAVVPREAMPAFGLPDVWNQRDHPIRLAFDFVFEFASTMVLAGCLLALWFRARVNGTDQQKYTDTTTTVFLLVVVLLGFVVEGLRIAAEGRQGYSALSFVGYCLSFALPADGNGTTVYDTAWLLHVLSACAFIAYVPVMRLVHSCATPIGRLMNSQKELLAVKKMASLKGLLIPKSIRPTGS